MILLTSSHRQNEILMNELGACQEKFGRRRSSELPIMKLHRSKQLVLKRSFNG